jgi:hypothetical protein
LELLGRKDFKVVKVLQVIKVHKVVKVHKVTKVQLELGHKEIKVQLEDLEDLEAQDLKVSKEHQVLLY